MNLFAAIILSLFFVQYAEATSAPSPSVTEAPLPTFTFSGCQQDEFAPYTCMEHDGRQRCYYVHVPDSIKDSKDSIGPVPLIVEFHGYTGCAESMKYYTSYVDKAEKEKFVLVWPQGVDQSWNAGICCGNATDFNVDDVGFVEKIVTDVINDAEEYEIDPSKIYMAGHSNGCAMAQRIAAEKSEWVAAVGCHSLYLLTLPASINVPTSMIEVHGNADQTVNYFSFFGYGAVQNLNLWKGLNGCSDDVKQIDHVTENFTITSYDDCSAGTRVQLVTLEDVDHTPYEGRDTLVDTTQLVLDFLFKSSKIEALKFLNITTNNENENENDELNNTDFDDWELVYMAAGGVALLLLGIVLGYACAPKTKSDDDQRKLVTGGPRLV